MNKIKFFSSVVFMLVIMLMILVPISCNNDFLDTEPLDKISAEAIWSDGALAEAFVFNVCILFRIWW